MIKNTRNNRLMGSIDGPSDVSYSLFVRDFIEDIEFSRPFAVTLTMNSVQWRSHSQNFRHFMNRLNQSFLKSGYRRYGKRLTVVPIIEGTRDVRPHYHCIIDNPFPERDREFVETLKDSWNKTFLAWMEQGGVFALSHLRGGGEYGATWHEQGMLLNKQNVFDDFAYAARYLHGQSIGSPRTTAIQGGSNGGLLVGATMLQNPDLFGFVIPQVGVMDMLRFNQFTIGWAWESDYGSPQDPEHFQNLLSYSPYHNIVGGACYPTTLVTTSERDDRVVPSHSYKFAARLQAAQGCNNPILLRVETRAGHGAGTPKDKIIEQVSEIYGLALEVLNNS